MSLQVVALSQAESLVGGGPSISGQAYLSVFVVLALLAGAAWALKRTNTLRRGAPSIVVETAVPLGERRTLVVVAVEGRRLLLGMTPQSIALVTELTAAPPAFGDRLDASLAEPRS